MNHQKIVETVEKIRRECETKTQNEQIEENREFFERYSAIFWMARDKTMNLKTLNWMLSLKTQIDNGKLNQQEVDSLMGELFYQQYVANKIPN